MSESFIPEALRDLVEFKDNGYLSDRFRQVVPNFNIKERSVDPERFQCREDGRELDEVHISQLMETVEKNVVEEDINSGVFGTEDQLPLIGELGGKFYVISGAHRLAALIKSEFTHEVPVRLYQAPETVDPVQLEAVFRLIAHHENEHKSMPKKLTRADRLRSLKLMLKNPVYQVLPASQLAKITGVSDKTITSLREKLGVKPEQVTTKDGKTRSSGRKSEGRSDRLAELEAENLKLRTIIERLKAESDRFKGEVHQWLETILNEEPDETPVVRPSVQLQLESPAPSPEVIDIEVESSPAPSQTFEKVYRLIDDWGEWNGEPDSMSINELTGRNWSRYKKELTPEQIKTLEDRARERGLKVEKRERAAKA